MRHSERAEAVRVARQRADDIRGGAVLDEGDANALARVIHDLATTVERYGAALEEDSADEQRLFEIAQSLGFSGVGLGRRRAILQVFEYAARQRATSDSDTGEKP